MIFAVLGLAVVALAGFSLIPEADESDSWNDDETDISSDDLYFTSEDSEEMLDGLMQESTTEDLYSEFSNNMIDTEDSLHVSEASSQRVASDSNVLYGEAGSDIFYLKSDEVAFIQNYQESELIVISYENDAPEVGFDQTDDGLSILADGYPVAVLSGVYEIDTSSILLSHISEDTVLKP